jgi:carbon storage regulator
MLVLTRKSNQSIMIGDNIEVSVLAIVGEKVRIGIQAPRDVPVFRKEVYLEIQDETLAAAKDVTAEVDGPLYAVCVSPGSRINTSEVVADSTSALNAWASVSIAGNVL